MVGINMIESNMTNYNLWKTFALTFMKIRFESSFEHFSKSGTFF